MHAITKTAAAPRNGVVDRTVRVGRASVGVVVGVLLLATLAACSPGTRTPVDEVSAQATGSGADLVEQADLARFCDLYDKMADLDLWSHTDDLPRFSDELTTFQDLFDRAAHTSPPPEIGAEWSLFVQHIREMAISVRAMLDAPGTETTATADAAVAALDSSEFNDAADAIDNYAAVHCG